MSVSEKSYHTVTGQSDINWYNFFELQQWIVKKRETDLIVLLKKRNLLDRLYTAYESWCKINKS